LYTDGFKSYDWAPPFRAYKFAVVFFFLSNVFLVVVPMIPPSVGYEPYEHLPYYVSCSVAEHAKMKLMHSTSRMSPSRSSLDRWAWFIGSSFSGGYRKEMDTLSSK
jgi:hypothetical protein